MQVRIHDLKRLTAKAGQSLVGLNRMDCGILFSTYDMLISGGKQTAAAKAKAEAAFELETRLGRRPDPGLKEFGEFPRQRQRKQWHLGGQKVHP